MSTSFSTIMLDSGETRIYVAILCRACVFLGSRTFKYAPRRKAAPFASCLYLRILTVDLFVLLSETRYKGASCALTGIRLGRVPIMYTPIAKPSGFGRNLQPFSAF